MVENDDMRLEFLEDFGVTDATFTDVSAGSSSTITVLLQTDYLLEETGGEVGVETCQAFQSPSIGSSNTVP